MSGYRYTEPAWVSKTLKADREKKLSTADRKSLTAKRDAVSMSLADQASNLRAELQPYNLISIEQELARSSDPTIINILKEEKNNILSLLASADKIKKEQEVAVAPAQIEQSFLEHIGSLLQNLFKLKEIK